MASGQDPVHPCPACGFSVFCEPYGSYELCPVCNWEDDGVQLANPCSAGGANGESLHEAQCAILCKLPLGVREHHGFSRSGSWRPLSDAEAARYALKRRELGLWNAKAIDTPDKAYWVVAA